LQTRAGVRASSAALVAIFRTDLVHFFTKCHISVTFRVVETKLCRSDNQDVNELEAAGEMSWEDHGCYVSC